MATLLSPQRLFRWHFHIPHHTRVSSHNMIYLWIQNCRSTASTAKKKPPVHVRTMRTPPNIRAVRQAMFGSPYRSAKKGAAALHLSHSSVWRILHNDLNFHLYKMVVVQQLSDLHEENRTIFSENFLNSLTRDEVILMHDEAHFHLLGTVKNKISVTGLILILSSFISILFTAHR